MVLRTASRLVVSFAITSRSARSLSTTSSAISRLNDPSLLEWNKASSSALPSFSVFDPASSGTVLADVQSVDAAEAILKSKDALGSWRDDTTASFRSACLSEWSRLVKSNIEDLATIMTLESGKPLAESRGEVNYAASFLDYYAAEAIRPSGAGGGFMVPSPFATPSGGPKGNVLAVQQAVGVCALISPWNFPMAMITRKAGPALAAGCTAVVKPSELTPLSAIALENLAKQAGIPSDVFQVVTASTEETPSVGELLATSPHIQKLSFTGSTRVGKLLMKQSSETVKRLSLELGGNAPFVVFEDADIDQAVDAAMASKFRNAGQTCVCADRFLVHSSVHDIFVEKLVKKTKAIKVGAGMEAGTSMGPLISLQAADSVSKKVRAAIEGGATCELGGNRLNGQFFEPTVLVNVSTESDIWKTETFGPVAPIVKFETEEEALAIANDAPVGLASYFCTKDLSRVFRFSNSLESGLVGVNEGIISSCVAPFGGVKESGLGREGSHLGLAEYLETKYIFINS
ncbi:MAG: hypothetical protein SGBAC_007679 [Bacillariaceae sp.]